VQSELVQFMIDQEDEDCPEVGLHLAAWQGRLELVQQELARPAVQLNSRVRPFLATPLRLAATAGRLECLQALLEAGADVSCLDKKAQTPLFVALVNQHWECARALLAAGADPNGSPANLCSPLSIMCQRGFYPGLRLLCEFGADTEDLLRLLAGLPGRPITSTVTYHHLECFALLLLVGAQPDLSNYRYLGLPHSVHAQSSVPHAIIKYRCPPEFVFLYREFGGDLWLRDERGELAGEEGEEAPALNLLRQFQETPLPLQSLCRLRVRRALGGHCSTLEELGLTPRLLDILSFRHVEPAAFDPADSQEVCLYKSLVSVLSEVGRDLQQFSPHPLAARWQRGLADQLAAWAEREDEVFGPPCPVTPVPAPHPDQVAGPPPPPPPAAPTPPKPRILRFPGAEGRRRT